MISHLASLPPNLNNLIEKILSETKFTGRVSALKQDKQTQKEILPFVTQYQPSVPNIKQMAPYTKPTTTTAKFLKNHRLYPFKKGKSLKDTLVRAKI